MSVNQAGIAQNVVNLGMLIERISTFGAKYNPVRIEYTIPNLLKLKTSGETVLRLLVAADNADKKSIAVRSNIFGGIYRTVTRTINAFRICGASEPTVQQAESLVREFKGIRASVKPTEEERAAAKAEGKERRINVMHNTNFDSKIKNFDGIVSFLKVQPEYGPNETDITVDALMTKLEEMKTANKNSYKTSAELIAARIQRDTVLFADDIGLVKIGQGVKLYVKSVFGASSPQYKSISALKFRKTKTISNPVITSSVSPAR